MTREEQLKEAQDNLELIRTEFKDDPALLACYEPSALFLVEQLQIEGGNR